MRSLGARIGVVLLVALGGACTSEEQAEGDRVAAARERAEAAADRLSGALMDELTRALDEGPPAHALEVCADVAQDVTEQAAAADGIDLGRTALRVRNPRNSPDAFERAMLEVWLRDGAPYESHAEVVDVEDGRALRYLRPIVLQAMCVTCHGPDDQLAPGVRAALAERYPEDRATGFRPGDLRGAVTVRVPLATE